MAHFSPDGVISQGYHLSITLAIIMISGTIFNYTISKNNIRNYKVFEKLKKNNDEIKESNERYDIVAKATSDTIWDWKIQEDDFIWNKGIQGIFGYRKEEVGNTSKWWFDRIHPEDSIKMSVKLYSFIEQKTEK
ncbi:MAG TPA: PAS domain-containing protein, partial [Flavobacterium sp.]|nr:PAS domain-containing protein [Flavobacterium sp.]